MWLEDFSVWGMGLAMFAAGVVMAGLFALGTPDPLESFLRLLWFPAVLLAFPILGTIVRFIADMARWSWERGHWRSRPYLDDEPPPAVIDALPSAEVEPFGIRYNVMGKEQTPLPRISAAELHDANWRRAGLAFLQAGHALGDKWSIRSMTGAGILTDPDWRVLVEMLSKAGLLTTAGETRPYPDYATSATRLRGGTPLPLPTGPAPRLTRTHTTPHHTQAPTDHTAEAQ